MEGRGRERGKTRRRRRTDGEDSHHHQPMHNQLTALITGLGWTEPEASLLSAVPTAHCSHTPAPHYSISQSESQSINQSPATPERGAAFFWTVRASPPTLGFVISFLFRVPDAPVPTSRSNRSLLPLASPHLPLTPVCPSTRLPVLVRPSC